MITKKFAYIHLHENDVAIEHELNVKELDDMEECLTHDSAFIKVGDTYYDSLDIARVRIITVD